MHDVEFYLIGLRENCFHPHNCGGNNRFTGQLTPLSSYYRYCVSLPPYTAEKPWVLEGQNNEKYNIRKYRSDRNRGELINRQTRVPIRQRSREVLEKS